MSNDGETRRDADGLPSVAVPGSAAGDLPGRTYDSLGPRVWILGGVMVLVGVVTTALMLGDFRSESYLYLAFYAIPANTAISVFPHEPVLVYYGKFAHLGITAGAATTGTLVAAYLDHGVFVPVLNLDGLQKYKEKTLYRRIVDYYLRWPFATLLVAGFTPIPFWPVKFLSFSVHYPLEKYLAAVAISRFPRYLLLAWLGSALDIPNWLLFGIFGVVISLYVVNAAPAVLERWRARESAAAGAGPGGRGDEATVTSGGEA